MRLEIYEHAKDQYIKRIRGKDKTNRSLLDRVQAETAIRDAVLNPEKILVDETRPQIHIKDNVAVIVGVETDIDGEYAPYTDMEEDDIVVPTVYKSETFLKEV